MEGAERLGLLGVGMEFGEIEQVVDRRGSLPPRRSAVERRGVQLDELVAPRLDLVVEDRLGQLAVGLRDCGPVVAVFVLLEQSLEVGSERPDPRVAARDPATDLVKLDEVEQCVGAWSFSYDALYALDASSSAAARSAPSSVVARRLWWPPRSDDRSPEGLRSPSRVSVSIESLNSFAASARWSLVGRRFRTSEEARRSRRLASCSTPASVIWPSPASSARSYQPTAFSRSPSAFHPSPSSLHS